MIMRTDINIVDVEQKEATGPSRHGGNKFPFRHLVFRKSEIAGRIFEQHGAAQYVLGMVDVPAHHIQRLMGQRQWQQIMAVMGAGPRPAQMVGNP